MTQGGWDCGEITSGVDPTQAPSTRHRWLFNRNTSLTTYCITIMVANEQNIPAVFGAYAKFLNKCIAPGGGIGFVGVEAGTRGHLHLQSAVQTRTGGNSKQHTDKLKSIITTEFIADMLGKIHVMVKPLTGMQGVMTMIGPHARRMRAHTRTRPHAHPDAPHTRAPLPCVAGYCTKDSGTEHFKWHAVNLTAS